MDSSSDPGGDECEEADFSCSPEFLAPEVISAGPQGSFTDMWSFGVLLYVSLSGLSPFLDDSDDETTNNVLRCDFSFPDEHFASVSSSAKDLVSRLLRVDPGSRASASSALASPWISDRATSSTVSSVHLATLVRRRLKKLNAVAPASLASRAASRLAARPESLYRTAPSS